MRRLEASALAQRSFQRFERMLAELRADDPSMQTACARGCSHCCYPGELRISAPEASAIAAHIEAQPEAERARLLARIEAAASAEHTQTARERWYARRPCPLLDEDAGTCVVYPVRPVLCRGWNSVDAAPCAELWHHREREVPIPSNPRQHQVAQEIIASQDAAVVRMGGSAERLEIAKALLIGLENNQSAT